MELLASRLLSLLAHHPDYPSDSLDETVRTEELADFSRYILFYLSAVANETNLSLIFHIFQRVKQVRDAISGQEAISQRLYTLSDLAQATTRKYADIYSQQHKIGGVGGHAVNILQTYPGKMRLPSSLFANLASHTLAQEIAETNFLSEDVDDRLDRIVRAFMKPPRHGQHHRRQAGPGGVAPMPARKRKSDGSRTSSSRSEKSPKRVKQGRQSTLTGQSMGDSSKSRASHRKRQQGLDDNGWGSDTNGADEAHSGPAASGTSSSARRRSGRRTSGNNVSYAEPDSDEDEEAMLGADQQEVTENEEEEDDDDGMSSDTDGSDHEGDGAVLPSEQMQEELTTEDAGPGSRAGSAAPSAGEGDAADSEDESVGAAPPEEAAGPAPLTNASNRLPQRSSLPGAKQAVLTSGDTRTRRSQRRAAR
ncbi:hypothetical protein KEM52_002681 [Ascosphaera acerosa]|nr:hypothetical protein KEM52_002681 [Ascosphaera acerosa]